ncbi:MAG: 1-acyl-sn-glycerol-3-phosphate acyltransferase [Desulfobacterales bacterium]|nr:1-acyl-sn-glycerol-3-phosphate acyltransferase [Desulfobacterales bacterium]
MESSVIENIFKQLNGYLKSYNIDRIDNRDPELIDRLCKWIRNPLKFYFNAEVRGVNRIPSGAGLYVGNHNSGTLSPDSFIFSAEVYHMHGVDDVPYGLGHEIAINIPIIHQIIMPLGAVRASHAMAHELFSQGKKVIVYPGGDEDAMRPYSKRDRIVFGGRKGYIQLALRENVPIIPVVSAGSHSTFMIIDDMKWFARLLNLDRFFRLKVWPLTLSIPWGLTLGPPLIYFPYPTKILIEVLPPIWFDRIGFKAANDESYVSQCAEEVESQMQAVLTRLSLERKRKR